MLHAAARDRTRLQSFLDEERQEGQSVKHTIAAFRMRVRDHSTLVNNARKDIY